MLDGNARRAELDALRRALCEAFVAGDEDAQGAAERRIRVLLGPPLHPRALRGRESEELLRRAAPIALAASGRESEELLRRAAPIALAASGSVVPSGQPRRASRVRSVALLGLLPCLPGWVVRARVAPALGYALTTSPRVVARLAPKARDWDPALPPAAAAIIRPALLQLEEYRP